VHHNPFYLLSALSMLAGCYALNMGLAPRTAEMGKLLALIGVLNFYELILLALGLYLIRARGLIRDGRTLLLLEIPFLVDLAFINAEASSVSFNRGLLLNAIVLSLALVKVGIVLRVLFGRVPGNAYALIAMQLSMLLMMPSAFKWLESRGPVTEAHFYGVWWALGLMLVAFEAIERLQRADQPSPAQRVAQTMRRLYLVLPLASAIVHLSILHWVYRVSFSAGDVSPLLIGIAVAAPRLPRIRRELAGLVRVFAPALAVVLALNDAPDVHRHLIGQLTLAPWLLTLAAAYLTWVYCFAPRRALRWIARGAAAAALAAYTPQIYALCVAGWQRGCDLAIRLIPRSALEWGVVAIGGAFAFLTLGAAVSLRKEADVIPEAPSTAAPGC
jgi:hypothetical protein